MGKKDRGDVNDQEPELKDDCVAAISPYVENNNGMFTNRQQQSLILTLKVMTVCYVYPLPKVGIKISIEYGQ